MLLLTIVWLRDAPTANGTVSVAEIEAILTSIPAGEFALCSGGPVVSVRFIAIHLIREWRKDLLRVVDTNEIEEWPRTSPSTFAVFEHADQSFGERLRLFSNSYTEAIFLFGHSFQFRLQSP